MNLDDRRFAQRVPLNIKVFYTLNNKSLEGFSIDISPVGIFIESKNPPEKDQKITMDLNLPFDGNKVPLQLHGIVERIVDKNEAGVMFTVPGFGVRFLSSSAEVKKQIRAFVDLRLMKERRQSKPVETIFHQPIKSATEKSEEVIKEKAPPAKVAQNQTTTPAEDVEFAEELDNSIDKDADNLQKQLEDTVPTTEVPRSKQAEKLYFEGLKAYRENDLSRAVELISQATKMNPLKPSYYNTLKEMEDTFRHFFVEKTCSDVEKDIDAEKYATAMEKLTNCYEKVPNNSNVLRLTALTLVKQNQDLARALQLAKKAYSMKVSDPENYYVLGLVYLKLNQRDRAKVLFQKAIQKGNHKKSLEELRKLDS